eukprot:356755-Chlamydomonas_euryale.AAC.5
MACRCERGIAWHAGVREASHGIAWHAGVRESSHGIAWHAGERESSHGIMLLVGRTHLVQPSKRPQLKRSAQWHSAPIHCTRPYLPLCRGQGPPSPWTSPSRVPASVVTVTRCDRDQV